MSEAAADAPIFVHAWWRAATTWFWAKLRDLPELRCYYEPLNERLAFWTADTLRRHRPEPAALARSRHPPMERPYFAEYLELMEGAGTGYTLGLSYDRYLLRPEDEDVPLQRYLAGLIGHAAGRGERPALCFVRSPLRSLWMRQRFPGFHIAQLRNPRDQWGSFRSQGGRGRSSYFVAGMMLIAERLRARHPGALAAVGRLPQVALSPRSLGVSGVPPPPEQEYALFVLLWLASALQSVSAADLVLDSDRVAADPPARRELEARLAGIGLRVDLSDATVRSHAELPLAGAALDRIEEQAVARLAGEARELLLFDPARARAALRDLSPTSRSLLQRAFDVLS